MSMLWFCLFLFFLFFKHSQTRTLSCVLKISCLQSDSPFLFLSLSFSLFLPLMYSLEGEDGACPKPCWPGQALARPRASRARAQSLRCMQRQRRSPSTKTQRGVLPIAKCSSKRDPHIPSYFHSHSLYYMYHALTGRLSAKTY